MTLESIVPAEPSRARQKRGQFQKRSLLRKPVAERQPAHLHLFRNLTARLPLANHIQWVQQHQDV